MEYRLEETRTVTLDGNGNATVIGVGPTVYGETWRVKRFSVNTGSRCKFTVHRGISVEDTTQIDATGRGDLDTSETDVPLNIGETLSFKWAGGTPGSSGMVRIEGTREVAGR